MSIIDRSVSRPFHIVDAPTPANLRLQFIYNFFEADERTVDGGSVLRNGRCGSEDPGVSGDALEQEWGPVVGG